MTIPDSPVHVAKSQDEAMSGAESRDTGHMLFDTTPNTGSPTMALDHNNAMDVRETINLQTTHAMRRINETPKTLEYTNSPEHWLPEHWLPEHWLPEHWLPAHCNDTTSSEIISITHTDYQMYTAPTTMPTI